MGRFYVAFCSYHGKIPWNKIGRIVLGSGFEMKYTESLKKNFQFRYVYHRGKSIANRQLVMYIMKNGRKTNRLGISVSKKVGKSVVRSHVTRLIRESYRNMEDDVKLGYDIVFIARNPCSEMTYHEMVQSMKHLCKKHQFFQPKQKEQDSGILS